MADQVDLELNEPRPGIGTENDAPPGVEVDPRAEGWAGMRLKLDQVLQSVEGFGSEQLKAAGIGSRDLVRYRAEITELLAQVVRFDGRRPSRRKHRVSALRLMGYLRCDDHASLFGTVLLAREEPPTVRAAAADALGLIGDAGQRELLRSCLDDPNASVRLAAVVALGRTGTLEEIDRLKRVAVLEDQRRVRMAAARAVTEVERRVGKAPSLPEGGEDERPDKRGSTTQMARMPKLKLSQFPEWQEVEGEVQQ